LALILLAGMQAIAQEAAQDSGDAQAAPARAPSGPPMTVNGYVTNSATGEALPRVLVRVEGEADAAVLTDGEGHFEIPDVPVGPQTIRLMKPGYRDRPYATEEVDAENDGPPHNVLVAPQMKPLGFQLTPIGAIHGHVELSTGDPAQEIPVVLVKQVVRYGRAVWMQGADTRTNGDGSFRFAGLPDGVYAVYTEPVLESEPAVTVVAPGSAANVERSGYPSVFFPDAREFPSAMRIKLGVGEQAEANILLTLEAFHTVTATAFFPNGRQFSPKAGGESSVTVSILDAGGHRLPYTGEFDAGTGTVQAVLPDGIYTFQVAATLNDPSVAGAAGGRASRNKALYTGFTELSVAGHAVTNLRIPLSPVPSWPVRVREIRSALHTAQAITAAGQGLESLVTVAATNAGDLPTEGGGDSATAEAVGVDQLDLTGAGFGPLWINVMVNDRSVCVDSFTAGGINLAREPLIISPAATPPPMELTLRDDCAQLTLQLPAALAAFLPGDEPFYTVYVIPDFDTSVDLPPMTIHSSSGGSLTMTGLTPGSYHVYVFAAPVRLAYRNSTALAALGIPGQAVTVTAGASASVVLEVPGQ